MKQLLTTFLLILSSSVIAMDFNADGLSWFYIHSDFRKGGPIKTNTAGNMHELWSLDGVDTINEKRYLKLYRKMSFADVYLPMSTPEIYSNQGFIMNLRQQDGKVFAIKEQYLQYMKSLYPEIEEFYLGPAEDENEVLLYDFTLNIGDTYPCADGATVTEVRTSQKIDGKEYKLFLLSNGIIIIENIGCVNSLGTLIAYQHTERIVESYSIKRATGLTTWEWQDFLNHGILLWLKQNDQMIYLTDFIETKDFNYFVIDNITNIRTDNISSSYHHIFDLSGRRLTAPHTGGVYIKDGKKMMIR